MSKNKEELEEFYEEFLTIMAESILREVSRENGGYTVDMAIEGRLDDLRFDIKEKINICKMLGTSERLK